MTKVVINACHGGFSLSGEAMRRYADLKGMPLYPEVDRYGFTTWWTIPEDKRPVQPEPWHAAPIEVRAAYNAAYDAGVLSEREFSRTDPVLVQVVEELGAAANGRCANLRVAEIEAGTHYRIAEYDGYESIETRDEIEWRVA